MTEPQAWAFAPHVHAAVDAGNLVLLDSEADAYFCLPGLADGFAPGPLAGGPGALPQALLEDLARARLVRRAARPSPPLEVIPPRRDLVATPAPRVGLRDARDVVAAWATLAPTFYRRPLLQVLERVQARAAGREPGDEAAAAARAARFNGLLPWSPLQGACLLQAAWLLEFLAQAGLSADWVFGVRTWPFSAHCWVQSGEVVLNDSVERVAPYRVILKA